MARGPDWYRDEELLLRELKLGEHSLCADQSADRSQRDPGISPEGQGRVRAPGRAPEIVGYEDLEELGRGGQGIVYSGTQASTQRRVAIKVLLAGAWAPEKHRRRFEREVKLVAGLQHPNIVRLYDSGLTNDGHPYYVMEFIEGVGLDELISSVYGGQPWVLSGYEHLAVIRKDAPDRRVPSRFVVRSALELMTKVGEAMGHAHRHGLIHRDLKPSNIRVDTSAEPHVLDFGLAKNILSTSADGAGTQVSLTGEFMGSLAWASPEQTEGVPGTVDPRSDVYSLGVILFQMLTGRFPYPVVGGFQQILEQIRNTDPPRPSGMRQDIDDEVDTIVLKCLAKEPERRYPDANGLVRDIRHYLAGEPIEAKSESATYRLRKRFHKHRMAVALVAALIVVGVMGAVTALTVWRAGTGTLSSGVSGSPGRTAPSVGLVDSGVCRVHEVAKLLPSDVQAGDYFGQGVSLTREPVWRIAAASPGDDEQGHNAGAVYVYRFDGASWLLEARLVRPEPEEGSSFGRGARLVGESLLVGGWDAGGSWTKKRVTHTFAFEDSSWVERARLHPYDDGQSLVTSGVLNIPITAVRVVSEDSPDAPGAGFSLIPRKENADVDRLAGAAPVEYIRLVLSQGHQGWVGPMGDDLVVVTSAGCDVRNPDCQPVHGTAYIVRRDPLNPSAWREESQLAPSDTHLGDRFGCSAAVEGDVVVIGAKYNDTQGEKSGAAYVFRYGDEGWVEEAQLRPSDPRAQKQFGCAVRMQGDIVLVGAYGDHENGYGAGAVYVFRFDGQDWVEEAKLLASDGRPKQVLGYSVAFEGDTAVSGAFYEQGADFGSVYVFRGLSDCNSNGDLDACEVARGLSPDRNENGLPDECEPFPQTLLENTTGGPDDPLLGPPDDDFVRITTGAVEYDFGEQRVFDGDGPDFNIYEIESGYVDFDHILVQVSDDGVRYAEVRPAPRPVVRIEGDGARGNDMYIRSYDLADTGLSSVRYVRIALATEDSDGQTGFDLDAIGASHLGSNQDP
jgi:serine/threonine protein kinase